MALNTILIASDFSNHAHYALVRAIDIARGHKASLLFLHVLKQPWLGDFEHLADMQQQMYSAKAQAEEKFLNLLKDQGDNLETQVAVSQGRAADEIVRYAQENQCDLIIAGAHGRYYINDFVMGTTSGGIIRQSHVPTLLIKKEPTSTYNKILLATDFSKVSKDAIEFTFNCFPEAQFLLLHVVDVFYRKYFDFIPPDDYSSVSENPETKDIIEKLDDFLGTCKVDKTKFQKKIMGGYFADMIVSEAEAWSADLISFGTHGNSKLHYLMMGSVAKRVLQLSTRDMLVVPPK